MKKIFRKIVGFIIAVPFCILIYLSSVFTGRQKAIDFFGPVVTYLLTIMAEISLIPKIYTPEEFNIFVKKMKNNISNLGILYDISITHEDDESIILHYQNCPHCEAFFSLGVPELGKYACDSDWVIANNNSDCWDFERNYEIGTGGKYCDHTYKRKYS